MQEISYQVFDKESGLPVTNMGDKYVRSLSERLNRSNEEIFQKLRGDIDKHGVKYMILLEKENILLVSGNFFAQTLASYYTTMEEAKEALG